MKPPDTSEHEGAPSTTNPPIDPGVLALALWIDRFLRDLIARDAGVRLLLPSVADYLHRLAKEPGDRSAQPAPDSVASAHEDAAHATTAARTATVEQLAAGALSALAAKLIGASEGIAERAAAASGATTEAQGAARDGGPGALQSFPTSAPAPGTARATSVAAAPPEVRMVPLKLGWGQADVAVVGSARDAARAAAAIQLVERSAPGSAASGELQADIGLIARRCRIKARACELVIRRLELEPGTEGFEAVDGEIRGLIDQAKALPLCFLWAPYRLQALPPVPVVQTAGRAYANLAAAAELMEFIDKQAGGTRFVTDGLHLMAEAQSALRTIMARTWLSRDEQDQLDAFLWVRRRTAVDQVYVDRYMRAGDAADPEQHAALQERIGALLERVRSLAQQGKAVTAVLNKLRYHARKLATDPDGSAETVAGLRAAAEVAEEAGMAPNDARTLEALAAALPRIDPETEESGFLAEAARAALERSGRAATGPVERSYSASVLRVREALRGRTVVMVGGMAYPHQRRRLIEAFELAELNWVEQTEHATSEPFEAPIARSETHLVLSLVKLTGHQHLDDVRRWTRKYEKPLVLLKAGYSPEQVAAAVLEQASEALGIE